MINIDFDNTNMTGKLICNDIEVNFESLDVDLYPKQYFIYEEI